MTSCARTGGGIPRQWGRLVALVVLTLLPAMSYGITQPDFNGDGFADKAIGAPYEDVGTVQDAGAVHVLYGGPSGLTTAGSRYLTQNSTDMPGVCEQGDAFGFALAAGDFNHDTFTDLAIGAPYDRVAGVEAAGAVHVLYGGPTGLSITNSQYWHQNKSGVADACEAGDGFGYSLVAGGFQYGDYHDLAIGVPFESIGTVSQAGAVHVLFNSPAGLGPGLRGWFHQNSSYMPEACEELDHFGQTLASLSTGGADYLVIGVPSEGVGSVVDAGALHILAPNEGGPVAGGQYWHQNSGGVPGTAQHGDFFASALTVGDFDGDGFGDLVVGVSHDDVGGVNAAGAVHIFRGNFGLTTAGTQYWHQNRTGIADLCEAGDNFGSALTTADFNGDGAADLAIGVPQEGVGTVVGAGAVHVLYNGGGALTATGSQFFTQATAGVEGVPQDVDQFGFALGTGDFDGDTRDDLAIGIPGETLGGVAAAGAVSVLPGSAAGLTTAGALYLTQDTAGLTDAPELNDLFGFAL